MTEIFQTNGQPKSILIYRERSYKYNEPDIIGVSQYDNQSNIICSYI